MEILLSSLYLAALGYPFKWAKTRGGFRAEYSSWTFGDWVFR